MASSSSVEAASSLPSVASSQGQAALIIQEGAAGFCYVDGSVDSNNSGFLGAGFANTDNAVGTGIGWSVNVPSAGAYRLEWRYANGGDADRSGNIAIGGNNSAVVNLAPTGTWESWVTEGVTLDLVAGINKITLSATEYTGLANIDSLSFSGGNITAAQCHAASSAPSVASSSAVHVSSASNSSSGMVDTGGCPQQGPNGYATNGDGITGGGNADPIIVSNASELQNALKGNDPRVVHFSGTIDTAGKAISFGSNKTLKGTNKNAKIIGGLTVGGSNVIIQNFTVQGNGEGKSPADAVNGSGSNIWFDHLAILDGGDGILDLVNGANNITTSWNKFYYTDSSHSHRLALLFGNDSGPAKCKVDGGRQQHTVHHNWFSKLVDQRMPRLYYGKLHAYNNFYDTKGSSYNIGIGTWGSALIENNYFNETKNPHQRQNNYPTFIEAVGNIYHNTSGKMHTGANGIGTIDKRFEGEECYTKLADPKALSLPYAYSADDAEDVPDLVRRCAGPQ